MLRQHCGFGKLRRKAWPLPKPISRSYIATAAEWRRTLPRQSCFKAAEQGDAVAEFLLGNQYAFGKGVPQDHREAMIWFRKAAEQSQALSRGHVRRRPGRAAGLCPCLYVVQSSGGRGKQSAVKTLEMAERRMTPAQIGEAQKVARDWKPASQPSPLWRSLWQY
ncbi:hypothetical protein [Bradyrhizobium sp. S3.3.6]|uniref:tetratricopeptide repeat protein n=1 Tax=Bradyrhizobium sp. S3.3.6 TaxID=3156429 RepID=UPI00339B5BA8